MSHTFSLSTNYSSIIVLVFRTPAIAVDQSSSINSTGQGIQLPAVTPSTQQGLAISGITPYSVDVLTIDSGFIIAENVSFVSGVAIGGAGAFLFYSSASPLVPLWTISASAATGATLLTFKTA
jgi:hypothetical protein